eukprot:CAMPEP_0202910438 /NCGR_PEP_ID=MMETSP1392-20130828/52077_1 /ASSEMBLY_ACC=CAM_ASM_000868 /TAXON_ID=225041 /ORGANISM="Chlamydomonas chlamydogama, Strain SAG 11-48b" /LENGTH=117 /DNA_ID=CAMNT_0049600557 /DNA_START=60 /DNA_END=410 /DNA_ORIENTATION=+
MTEPSTANMSPTATAVAVAGAGLLNALPKGVLTELFTSGISVGFATAATNPLDVVKVRLQLESSQLRHGERPPGMVRTAINAVRNEGVTSLMSGVNAAVARGFLYGGVRLGLYTPIK